MRTRDNVGPDPLESLLDASEQGAPETAPFGLESPSAANPHHDTAGPANLLYSTSRRSYELGRGRRSLVQSTSSSGSDDQAQENKLQLVVQKLVDIKQRLDSLPPASSQTRQRKRQAVETLEDELSIPASRCWRTPSPLGQPFAGSISSSPSFDSGISSDTGMPSLLNVLPSQDFRRQLFKGIVLNPMWKELSPMPIDVLYDNLFLGNWNLQLPLRRLQQTVAIGQLSELSRSSFCELISATTATLAASTSCHQDPNSIQGRRFAAMAAEQEVLLHTMRAFIYGICSPWQWGQFLVINYPFHIEVMDLIQFIRTLQSARP
ncbi:hypothetical protein WJX84_008173 [Apatococcus fuscideae]|uniref:Uncharacterized protein n=1 Tax=Apatococcus fuscideae TaxID=2026836 RepID=A0AAW1T4B5_9CHLO